MASRGYRLGAGPKKKYGVKSYQLGQKRTEKTPDVARAKSRTLTTGQTSYGQDIMRHQRELKKAREDRDYNRIQRLQHKIKTLRKKMK